MKKKEQKKKAAKSAEKGKRATAQPHAQAKALERKRIEVAAHQLRGAPWNPRPEITSESVADITASIREIGLIQPLVVMMDPEKKPVGGVNFYLVVAGHRRFKACVDAGLSPIPCDVIDCDVPTAKRVTMIENLQRGQTQSLAHERKQQTGVPHGLHGRGMAGVVREVRSAEARLQTAEGCVLQGVPDRERSADAIRPGQPSDKGRMRYG